MSKFCRLETGLRLILSYSFRAPKTAYLRRSALLNSRDVHWSYDASHSRPSTIEALPLVSSSKSTQIDPSDRRVNHTLQSGLTNHPLYGFLAKKRKPSVKGRSSTAAPLSGSSVALLTSVASALNDGK